MISFIASRISFAALVLLLLSGFVFTLFFVAPGDPARIVAGVPPRHRWPWCAKTWASTVP